MKQMRQSSSGLWIFSSAPLTSGEQKQFKDGFNEAEKEAAPLYDAILDLITGHRSAVIIQALSAVVGEVGLTFEATCPAKETVDLVYEMAKIRLDAAKRRAEGKK